MTEKAKRLDSNLSYTERGKKIRMESPNEIENKLKLLNKSLYPVLVRGPAGSGKTYYLDKVFESYKVIQLDDECESKTLFGSWSISEGKGFEWLDGIMVKAMREGIILIFENVDKYPSELTCSITIAALRRQVFIMERNELVVAKDGFFIFGTTTSKDKTFYDLNKELDKWTILDINYLEPHNLLNILIDLNSNINPNIVKFILNCLNTIPHSQIYRPTTQKDVFLLFKRIKSIFLSNKHRNDFPLLEETKVCIIREVYCLLFAHIPDKIERQSLLVEFGKLWGLTITAAFNECKTVKLNYSPSVIHLNALRMMTMAIGNNEPVLLVGDTGTGKTSLVDWLADGRHQVAVYNFSDQSSAGDLLGFYIPENKKINIKNLIKDMTSLYDKTFFKKRDDAINRENFLKLILEMKTLFKNNRLSKLHKLMETTTQKMISYAENKKEWLDFLNKIKRRLFDDEGEGMKFIYKEGLLAKAAREGFWLVLDEVNLAPPAVLQILNNICHPTRPSLYLIERGEEIPLHKDFRIFGCMNPPYIRSGSKIKSTAGKKELPCNIRRCFTEVFIDEIEDNQDLEELVSYYLNRLQCFQIGRFISPVVRFYQEVRGLVEEGVILDGKGCCPKYSLRSLVRALKYAVEARLKQTDNRSLQQALSDGLYVSFVTPLKQESRLVVQKVIDINIGISTRSNNKFNGNFINIEGYNLSLGTENIYQDDRFIITQSTKDHIRDIARILASSRYPILLEGNTSVGKTSLVKYIAGLTGHKYLRINNHQHTDIQDYIGQHITDLKTGKFIFKEGNLIKAMKKGYWVILDELNLAPSEVLEVLNRLLDDNRQLYISDLNETINSHPDFQIFATQNPVGIYGGRKQLSSAFRNRFVQLFVDDYSLNELRIILNGQNLNAPSHIDIMLNCYNDIKNRRLTSNVFTNITIRDLLKWASRICNSKLELAQQGFYLLVERLRNVEDIEIIKNVLIKHCISKKQATLANPLEIDYMNNDAIKSIKSEVDNISIEGIGKVAYTTSMCRLLCLLKYSLDNREPVLLVGGTGMGKTTACQLISYYFKRNIRILNCHQNTEASDIIGSVRPERKQINELFEACKEKLVIFLFTLESLQIEDLWNKLKEYIFQFKEEKYLKNSCEILKNIIKIFNSEILQFNWNKKQKSDKNKISELIEYQNNLLEFSSELKLLYKKSLVQFDWVDGPLVLAMKQGEIILIDEISLADDGVLERMNSVLETPSVISLTEKGGGDIDTTQAAESFRIIATMNPGGDYGKRELSPALRNRFTEIFVPDIVIYSKENQEFVETRLFHCTNELKLKYAKFILDMASWYNLQHIQIPKTFRDIKKWADLLNSYLNNCQNGKRALFNSTLNALSDNENNEIFKNLINQKCLEEIGNYTEVDVCIDDVINDLNIYLPVDHKLNLTDSPLAIESPTTKETLLKICRALKIPYAVLLEGSPGTGKTAIIQLLADLTGNKLIRVNLSEHTDIADLVGSDLPVIDNVNNKPKFMWVDGVLTNAMRAGSWILLDEINLATQQVLEGLNSILDHRRELYLPETNQLIKCSPNFKIFAAQNPAAEGGGRKNLPKSFLNRFSRIAVPKYHTEDYIVICKYLYEQYINPRFLSKLVAMHQDIQDLLKIGVISGIWNLRDLQRLCDLIIKKQPTEDIRSSLAVAVLSKFGRNSSNIINNFVPECKIINSAHFSINTKDVPTLIHPLFINGYDNISLNLEKDVLDDIRNIKIESTPDDIVSYHKDAYACICHGIHGNMPVLLTGAPDSGKTYLLRKVGVKVEIPIVGSMDATDILGSFQQVDSQFYLRKAITILKTYPYTVDLINNIESIITSSDFKSLNNIPTFDNEELLYYITRARVLGNDTEFDWIDSELVEAIKEGKWVLLKNIDKATPAILDRLNSLLEPNKVLYINEFGRSCSVTIHENFRIFFTAVDAGGKGVSSALRNRCLEVRIKGNVDFTDLIVIDDTCNLLHTVSGKWEYINTEINNWLKDQSYIVDCKEHKYITSFTFLVRDALVVIDEINSSNMNCIMIHCLLHYILFDVLINLNHKISAEIQLIKAFRNSQDYRKPLTSWHSLKQFIELVNLSDEPDKANLAYWYYLCKTPPDLQSLIQKLLNFIINKLLIKNYEPILKNIKNKKFQATSCVMKLKIKEKLPSIISIALEKIQQNLKLKFPFIEENDVLTKLNKLASGDNLIDDTKRGLLRLIDCVFDVLNILYDINVYVYYYENKFCLKTNIIDISNKNYPNKIISWLDLNINNIKKNKIMKQASEVRYNIFECVCYFLDNLHHMHMKDICIFNQKLLINQFLYKKLCAKDQPKDTQSMREIWDEIKIYIKGFKNLRVAPEVSDISIDFTLQPFSNYTSLEGYIVSNIIQSACGAHGSSTTDEDVYINSDFKMNKSNWVTILNHITNFASAIEYLKLSNWCTVPPVSTLGRAFTCDHQIIFFNHILSNISETQSNDNRYSEICSNYLLDYIKEIVVDVGLDLIINNNVDGYYSLLSHIDVIDQKLYINKKLFRKGVSYDILSVLSNIEIYFDYLEQKYQNISGNNEMLQLELML